MAVASAPFDELEQFGFSRHQETLEMRKLFAVVALGMVALALDERDAQAQGIHFGLGGVHVDVGQPHGHRHQSLYRGGYGHGGGYHHGVGYGGGWRGHHGYGHRQWHDTSHYDYHPGGYERHYDHFHYVPPHYDFHRQGHYDYH